MDLTIDRFRFSIMVGPIPDFSFLRIEWEGKKLKQGAAKRRAPRRDL